MMLGNKGRILATTFAVLALFTSVNVLAEPNQDDGQKTNQGLHTKPSEAEHAKLQVLVGKWVIDLDGNTMLNPQTSGLKYRNGFLYSLSDGSADETQRRRLHKLDMSDASIVEKYGPSSFDESVQNSCFYPYLKYRPDYEALVPLNDEASEWVFVTEDAREGAQLSAACQTTYQQTNSTRYPTLLVRLTLRDQQLTVTGVRPVQFPADALVGDFPNDGIEGLALTKDKQLLLGLEKDSKGQPRVFSVPLTPDFWQNTKFVQVQDANLLLPTFSAGNHPINGMDVYYPDAQSSGYLIAAARNDNELWIVDLAKQKPTKIVPLLFLAPSNVNADIATNATDNKQDYCAPLHEMNNASLEGLAVVGNQIYAINDPWKVNYSKNIVCQADTQWYDRFSPLLFQLTIQPDWFK